MSKQYIDADKYKKDLIHLGFLPALVTRVLDKQPTADVVEVVRCKDCKYCLTDDYTMYCERATGLDQILPDDYCSYGERSENGT